MPNDTDPNVGIGTPITGGLPGIGSAIDYPLPYTLLSLGRYAQLMGIPPLSFWGGVTPALDPAVFPADDCASVWYQHEWQNHDQVSREQVTNAIAEAEGEIARLLGYWPAPVWLAQEVHMYERPYDRQLYGNGVNVRSQLKAVNTDFGRIIDAGQRTVYLVSTPSVAGGSLIYTDEDGDNFYETATIQVATSLTNECEIKLYFTGHVGDPEWEIRPIRRKYISAGIITFILDSWLLIDRDLYELYPTSDGFPAIDVSDTSNFVVSVDVYREYVDTSLPSSQFLWEAFTDTCATCGGSGCGACSAASMDGCTIVRDPLSGILAPNPATYDAISGMWNATSWQTGREPDYVKLWYKAGEYDQKFLRGLTCEPLSLYWAQAIAWLATARLDRPFCSCGNVQASVDVLREDLALSESNRSFFITPEMANNPLGTKRGEVMAWKRINKIARKRMNVALI